MGDYLERRFWNVYAKSYDNLAKHFQPYKDLVQEVCDHVDEHAQGRSLRILDAGCGTGNYSLELARRGHSVIGLDVSDAMLARADRKAADMRNLEFGRHDLTQPLLFDDGEFDAAISTMVFYTLPEPSLLARELRRVVADEGTLVAVTAQTPVRVFGAVGEAYRDHGLLTAARTVTALFGVGVCNLFINVKFGTSTYNLMDEDAFSAFLRQDAWEPHSVSRTYTCGIGTIAACRTAARA